MRLFRRFKNTDDNTLFKFLKFKLGFVPKKIELYELALTHKSFSNRFSQVESNERLEFLGDAILDSVVAEYLYLKFPEKNEGFLTKLKSKIVSRKSLSVIGASLGLRSYLKYQKNRNINFSTLEGNALEAIIGAMYLDLGYIKTKKVLYNAIFSKFIDINKLLTEDVDFKSRLYIWSQKNKLNLDFIVKNETHNGSFWEYESLVNINGKEYGSGKGNSKKEAEQNASKQTLILMGVIEIN